MEIAVRKVTLCTCKIGCYNFTAPAEKLNMTTLLFAVNVVLIHLNALQMRLDEF